MKNLYRRLLRLYPRDYRALFAAEMLAAFEEAAAERHARGWRALLLFTISELAGLVLGAAAEWVAKFTTSAATRGRCLPDRLRMRPPGVPWETFYAGAFADVSQTALPPDFLEARRRTEFLVGRVVHAIANHDFQGARNYCEEERKQRERLRWLQAKYGIDE